MRRFKHAHKAAQGLDYFGGPTQAAVHVQKEVLVGGRSIDVVHYPGEQKACCVIYLNEKEIDKDKLVRNADLVLYRFLDQTEEQHTVDVKVEVRVRDVGEHPNCDLMNGQQVC